jgi:PHD/YefM family antitoxin component YafN of YafNO toxin-antitoxin module
MLECMENRHQAITPETEQVLQKSGGPLQIVGQQGNYVVMRLDVYDAMLGISDDEDAETLASVRRGLADVAAGRTHDADEAFDRLESRYAS